MKPPMPNFVQLLKEIKNHPYLPQYSSIGALNSRNGLYDFSSHTDARNPETDTAYFIIILDGIISTHRFLTS
jgi:hypothetical protein